MVYPVTYDLDAYRITRYQDKSTSIEQKATGQFRSAPPEMRQVVFDAAQDGTLDALWDCLDSPVITPSPIKGHVLNGEVPFMQ